MHAQTWSVGPAVICKSDLSTVRRSNLNLGGVIYQDKLQTLVWPPLGLKPSGCLSERKCANSLRLALPRMMAPAARSNLTIKASLVTVLPRGAKEPAVVFSLSTVPMLSLRRTCRQLETHGIHHMALETSMSFQVHSCTYVCRH